MLCKVADNMMAYGWLKHYIVVLIRKILNHVEKVSPITKYLAQFSERAGVAAALKRGNEGV